MPIIRVLIFRGTGGVYNPDHPYHGEPALVRAGHVGVSGVIGSKIIGFHPTSEAAEALGGEKELLAALKDKQPQLGRLQDDDAYFDRAAELVETTVTAQVVMLEVKQEVEEVAQEIGTKHRGSVVFAYEQYLQWCDNGSKPQHPVWYGIHQ